MPAQRDPIDKPAPVADKPSALATIGRYRKTLTAIVGAGLTWATAALGPDTYVSTAEWIALGVAVATALGVYGIKNEPVDPIESE